MNETKYSLFHATLLDSFNNGEFMDNKVFTPVELIKEIVDQIDVSNGTILVISNIEFALELVYTYKVDPSRITLLANCVTKEDYAGALGINHYYNLEEVEDMNFDIIVGNPPFSAPDPNKTAGKFAGFLYQEFFAKSLELSNGVVAMVLPTTDRKLAKGHNELLREYANKIEYIDSSIFSGITMPMWYVICDNNSTETPDTIDWSITGDSMNTIPWTKGKVSLTGFKYIAGDHGSTVKNSDNDITIYHKVNITNGLVIKYADPIHVQKNQLFPNTGYAVLMPQTFNDDGWSLVEIVECNGRQAAFNGMNIVFTDTKEQAENLVEYMKTEEFINEGNKVKQGFNNMTRVCLRSIKSDYTI